MTDPCSAARPARHADDNIGAIFQRSGSPPDPFAFGEFSPTAYRPQTQQAQRAKMQRIAVLQDALPATQLCRKSARPAVACSAFVTLRDVATNSARLLRRPQLGKVVPRKCALGYEPVELAEFRLKFLAAAREEGRRPAQSTAGYVEDLDSPAIGH